MNNKIYRATMAKKLYNSPEMSSITCSMEIMTASDILFVNGIISGGGEGGSAEYAY